jgi:predicted metal-binding membrane protein
MPGSVATLEAVLKRDRAIVLAALVLVAALAWADLAAMAADMGDGDAPARWSAGYFTATMAMWAIMMAGMMIPSAAPAILLFAALRRHAKASSAAPALLFACGYLVAWTAFSLFATVAQWRLSEAAMLSSAMRSESAAFAGALFVAAGLFQFSGLKAACLAKCRSPAQFLVERGRDGALGALVMGMEHGTYCVGCCWALMALLFAFGVMNLLWVAALAAWVLAEKLLPAGPAVARAGGAAMMGLGVVLFIV